MLRKIAYMLLGILGCGIDSGSENTNLIPHCKQKMFDHLVATMLSKTIPLLDADAVHLRESDYVILDAREFEEYAVSHLENALWLGYKQPNWEVLHHLDSLTPILIYCSIGYRSEKMGEILYQKGFRQVYNLYGSIFEWANRGYLMVDNQNTPTIDVHGYSASWALCIDQQKANVVYFPK
jgi:rhodanese-related sulfurtransferase